MQYIIINYIDIYNTKYKTNVEKVKTKIQDNFYIKNVSKKITVFLIMICYKKYT